ncbi:MAG: hypothetical protein ACI9HK_006340, partial [Pirellulaceae bacterium]
RMRVPGTWSSLDELNKTLPGGFRMSPTQLTLPDGSKVGVEMMPADDQFPSIFRMSCRQEPSRETLEIVDNYTYNVAIVGPGGSLEYALRMGLAAAAVVVSGGAGVFIDNAAISHCGSHWLDIVDDASTRALTYAFVNILRVRRVLSSSGMHVFGLRDIVMPSTAADMDAVKAINYMCSRQTPLQDGHVVPIQAGPRYRATVCDRNWIHSGSPLYNPFGHLKLTPATDSASCN